MSGIKIKKFKLIFLLILALILCFVNSFAQTVSVNDIYTEPCDTVYIEVCVQDTLGRFIHNLGLEDFRIQEIGELIDPSTIRLIGDCPGESSMVDIVLLLDMSTSMNDETMELEANIPVFVAGLAGMDYRIALIRFCGCPAEPDGDREIIRTEYTGIWACRYRITGSEWWATTLSEFNCLFSASWDITVDPDAREEDHFGAMVYAIENLVFRPYAKKVFILFTDERPQVDAVCDPYLDYTDEALDSIVTILNANDIELMPVTPHDGEFFYSISDGDSPDRRFYLGYYEAAERTGGAWFHLYSADYSALVDSIAFEIAVDTCCYLLSYVTPNFCAGEIDVQASVTPYGTGETTYEAFCPPIPEVIMPIPCGGITSCKYQEIQIEFHQIMTDVDTSSIILRVDATNYTFHTASELAWLDDSVLEFTPANPWNHNQTVNFSLIRALDEDGCPINTVSCSFIVDTLPPEYSNEYPFDNSIVYENDPPLSIDISDSPAGVDSLSLIPGNTSIWVNRVLQTGYTLTWNGTTLEFIGISFDDADSVTVCIDSIWDDPDYDYCPPNWSSYCWSFFIATDGPVPEIVRPLPNTYSACIAQDIIMYIVDIEGVVPSTIELLVEGITYTVDSAYLTFSDDSVLTFQPPAGFWSNGQVVNVTLLHAEDVYRNDISAPVTWSFIMDLTAPVAVFQEPGEIMTSDYSPHIIIEVFDSLSGLDPGSLVFQLNEFSYYYGDFDWEYSYDSAGGILVFDPVLEGINFAPGDTVTITIYSCDTPDYCPPNCDDSIWQFFIEPKAECMVHPNPFSPNEDDINDIAVFDYPRMFSEKAELIVYTLRNVEVWRGTLYPISHYQEVLERSWNGRDKDGKALPEGIYLYIIERDDKVVCNGTVILAR
ncbi:gliding motility-associated C-terminal domain-containing protein [bacterium]|nr:gliding motility-associated C-terminal domain-containing protein [bacterium]